MVSVTFLKCSRCHTNVVFSVVRVVRCDCGFVNNVAAWSYMVLVVGKCFCCRSTVVSFRSL